MAESIGLIERAAALLRDRGASEPEAPAAAQIVDPDRAQPDLILDPARLARYGIAMPSEKRFRTAEEFRLIKRSLMRVWSQDGQAIEHQSRSVMITSARPGEGKTFVAINLAMAFAAEADGEALLIDADSEHSMLPLLTRDPIDKGIVDVLTGELRLSDVTLRTNLPRLTMIPSGAGGAHVPELFSGRKMAELLTQLTARSFGRVIVIDTPPCLVTSEAATLAPLMSNVVLVVEAYRTQQSDIESCLAQLSGCPNVCLLLNKSDATPGNYFGKYGYYYFAGRGDGDEGRAGRRR